MKKMFLLFLIKNLVFIRYFINFYNDDLDRGFKSFINSYTPYSYFTAAFDFSYTKEKIEFWRNINDKWINYLENNYK